MQFHFRLHKFCIFAAEAPAEVDPAHVQTVRAALRGGVRLQVLRGFVSGLEVRPGAVQVRTRGKYTGDLPENYCAFLRDTRRLPPPPKFRHRFLNIANPYL